MPVYVFAWAESSARECLTLVLRSLEDRVGTLTFAVLLSRVRWMIIPAGMQDQMKKGPEGPSFSRTTNDQRRFAQPTFCGTRGSGIAAAIFAPKYLVRAFSNFSISTCFSGC